MAEKGPWNFQSLALCCQECYNKLHIKSKSKIRFPYYSMANGFRLGYKVREQLPQLTVLGRLIISIQRPFQTIIQITDSSKHCRMKGHFFFLESKNDTAIHYVNQTFPFLGELDLTVAFLGKLDRWLEITGMDTNRKSRIVRAFGKVFEVDWHAVHAWLRFLKAYSPSYSAIQIDVTNIYAQQLQKQIDSILYSENVHIMSQSQTNIIDKLIHQNHPNAPRFEEPLSSNEDDGNKLDEMITCTSSFLENNIPFTNYDEIDSALLNKISKSLQGYVQHQEEILVTSQPPNQLSSQSPQHQHQHQQSPLSQQQQQQSPQPKSQSQQQQQ